MNPITIWDLSVLDALQGFRTPGLDAFLSTITHLGDGGIFWIAVALVLLCVPKTRKLGLCVAAALLFDVLLCNVLIKPLAARVRPYEFRDVVLLIRQPTDASFPSGHAAAAFAVTTALARRRSRLAIPAAVLAVTVAFSRLYLYVHYPTDVFAGIALGALCGWLGCLVYDRLLCRIFRKKET